MVFYRKYRPQTLDDIFGQEIVKASLKGAFSSSKLAHAYLFCGPKGTGKTSAARILAKMVNCEKSDSAPCNRCSSCLSITDGSNLDLVEMDAASNRGIEDIRSLRETIKLSPTAAKKKVYIIDEVHMLTGEAFNALLKTLEEPPDHVLFILATTDPQKIPQTILSRVQRLDFKLATLDELSSVLKKVAKEEKIKIDDEAILALAKRAQGSFRDAEKLLDQLSSLPQITKEIVEENLSISADEHLLKMLEDIAKKDAAAAMLTLSSQLEKGTTPREITISLLDILRQILLIKNNLGGQLLRQGLGGEQQRVLADLSAKFGMEDLIAAIKYFQGSLEQGRYVSIPSLPLEVAIVESCSCKKIGQLEKEVVQKVAGEEKATESTVDEPLKQAAESPKQIASSKQPIAPSGSFGMQKIQDKWSYVLETVRANNFSLEALLRSVQIISCDDGIVVVEVPYPFHQRILEASKNRNLLESVLSDILGQSVRISFVLSQKQASREELANVEIAPDDELVRVAAEIFNVEVTN